MTTYNLRASDILYNASDSYKNITDFIYDTATKHYWFHLWHSHKNITDFIYDTATKATQDLGNTVGGINRNNDQFLIELNKSRA